MTEPKFTGRLNSDTGNPELVKHTPRFEHNRNADRHELEEVVATGGYHGFAYYVNGDDDRYVVFSPYFEGKLPPSLIGVALKLTKV